ncbi:RING-H2 finger protein ATL1-like [Phragmites australis]|uniref:RING-H2 finger protein ATL1-like n=1 Tax=Phragmites australis TaxID=29695 RepID=UPI002D7809EC|nr:RING-H2 finger protein ATL1-like [Phragmites australis]
MDAAAAGRGIVIPALLFPPPPPPLPSYSNSYSYSSTSHHPPITSFPILVLTVLGILTTSVLLLTYYVLVIRCCLNWHGSSDVANLIARRGRRRGGSNLPVSGTPAEARGLEESAIQALPTFRYRKAIKNAADSAPTSECAVCLSEFEEEERVRMLPSCLHVFHVDCIDTWLQGNANCPLCRTAITSHCLLPLNQLRRPEELVIQVTTGTEEEEEGAQAPQQEASMSMAAVESAGHTAADQQVSSDSERRKGNNARHVIDISSKGDECIAARKDRDVLPLRRSFSMGSLGGGEVHLQIQKVLQRNTHFHGDDRDSSSGSSV